MTAAMGVTQEAVPGQDGAAEAEAARQDLMVRAHRAARELLLQAVAAAAAGAPMEARLEVMPLQVHPQVRVGIIVWVAGVVQA
jgi:hypothetical protein